MTRLTNPVVRRVAAGLLLASVPTVALPQTPPGQEAPSAAVVFMYSRFGDDANPTTSVRIEQFQAHLQELRTGGYTVLPLVDIVGALQSGRPLPDRTVALTIDDAHASVYREAWPRLRTADFPFTLFVTTDNIDRGSGSYMSWSQLRELASAGVAIGNLTASHAHLMEQDRAYVLGQIIRANERLQVELGRKPQLFAYPYGEWNRAVREMAAGQGFVAAVGLQSGVLHPAVDTLVLPRFPLNEAFGSLERFRLAAQALPLIVGDATPSEAVVERNPPDVGFTVDPAMGDLDQLACFASGLGRTRVEAVGARRVELRLSEPLPSGRTRINCTMPASEGRWRWHGIQVTVP